MGDKSSLEHRIYISSLPGSDAEGLGTIVRGHWSIENRLHWLLDVILREDQGRIRKGSAPEAAAILRHIVLNLLRMDPNPRGSIKSRRIRAAGVPTYRLQAIMGVPR
jgi:predicted transposase YbfD/YdcC